MSNQQEQQVLETGESLEHALVMGEALDRLRKNPDFKTVITEGYLEGKVLASVSLLAVPQIKASNRRPNIMEDLVAASNLQYFLQMVDQAHEGAKNPILSDEETAALAEAEGE